MRGVARGLMEGAVRVGLGRAPCGSGGVGWAAAALGPSWAGAAGKRRKVSGPGCWAEFGLPIGFGFSCFGFGLGFLSISFPIQTNSTKSI